MRWEGTASGLVALGLSRADDLHHFVVRGPLGPGTGGAAFAATARLFTSTASRCGRRLIGEGAFMSAEPWGRMRLPSCCEPVG